MPKHMKKGSDARPQIATKRLGTGATRKFGAAPTPANLPRAAENPAPPNQYIDSANAVRVPKRKEEL